MLRLQTDPHVFDDADKRDGVAGLRVVLVAAQDERRRHEHVEVEVVRLDARLRRHLRTWEIELRTRLAGCGTDREKQCCRRHSHTPRRAYARIFPSRTRCDARRERESRRRTDRLDGWLDEDACSPLDPNN